LILPSFDGQTIGNHPLINRFVKGVFRLRPPAPRYNYTWDVNLLLKLFEDWPTNNNLSILHLTVKLTALLAIITAQRVQGINSIDINNIEYDNGVMVVKIDKILKTSRPGSLQPFYRFPPYQIEKLCIAKTIIDYLNVTYNYRQHSQLLLSIERPFKPVSNQTVSRWLKNCLDLAGINTNIFKAHSFRGASTSKT